MDWKGLSSSFKDNVGRIFRGCIVAAWIGILVWLGMLVWFGGLAARDQTIRGIMRLFPYEVRYKSPLTDFGSGSPNEMLKTYLSQYYADFPPPLEALLDLIVKNPGWMDRDFTRKDRQGRTFYDPSWVKDQYFALFSRADSILRAIVSDRTVDPRDFSVKVPELPESFKDFSAKTESTIKLPQILTSWITEQRIREDQKKETDALVNTFFILIVLGAFGSLIFLTKDYIEHDVETSLAAYFFRPVLGMFLALAVFLIDMLAHSVISTADILKVRHETLYVLAFAAGLLSEQAYTIVSTRAQEVLEKLKERSAVSKPDNK